MRRRAVSVSGFPHTTGGRSAPRRVPRGRALGLSLLFDHAGGDNFGILLANLESREGAEPGSLSLLALGLALLGPAAPGSAAHAARRSWTGTRHAPDVCHLFCLTTCPPHVR